MSGCVERRWETPLDNALTVEMKSPKNQMSGLTNQEVPDFFTRFARHLAFTRLKNSLEPLEPSGT
jgi:hypothetical protein